MRIVRESGRSADFEDVLRLPLFAYLASTSRSGPRVSPVWFLWEDNLIWIVGNRRTDSFPGRIQNDGRSAIAVVEFDPAGGVVRHIGLRGSARVTAFDEARARRLLRKYLGADENGWDHERFVQPLRDRDNILVRFAPDTIVAREQSYDVATK